MNKVINVTKYKWNGVEYDSLSAIHQEIENRIGKIIDRIDHTLNHKQKLNIYDAIVNNRDALVELLTVQVEMDEDSLQGDTQNILSITDKI